MRVYVFTAKKISVQRVSAFSGLECWTGVLEWSHWNGVLESMRHDPMAVVVYNASEITKACTVKTEACCAHTNSVHDTLQFLQCDTRTY